MFNHARSYCSLHLLSFAQCLCLPLGLDYIHMIPTVRHAVAATIIFLMVKQWALNTPAVIWCTAQLLTLHHLKELGKTVCVRERERKSKLSYLAF